jgi:DNA primase
LCGNPSSKTDVRFQSLPEPAKVYLDSLLSFSFRRFPMTTGLRWVDLIVRVDQEQAKWAITSSSTSIGSVFNTDAAL